MKYLVLLLALSSTNLGLVVGNGPPINIFDLFNSIAGNGPKSNNDCDFFPFMQGLSDPGLLYIIDQINCWMCKNNKLMTKVAMDVNLVIQKFLEKYPIKDCSKPDKPAPLMIAFEDDEYEGIDLFDIDESGNYIMRDDFVATGEEPYYFITNAAGDRLYAIEDNIHGRTNFTVYVKDECTGRFLDDGLTYDVGDSWYYLALHSSEKYMVSIGIMDGIVTLIHLYDDGDFEEVDNFDIAELAGDGDYYPCKVGFSPVDDNVVAVAYTNSDTIVLLTLDETDDTLNFFMNLNLPPDSLPITFIFADDGEVMYVLNLGTVTVSIIHISRDSINETITDLTIFNEVPTGETEATSLGNDGRIVLHPSGDYLYVMFCGLNTITIYEVDPADGDLTQIDVLPIDSIFAFDMVITPDGKQLLVSDQLGGNVDVFTINESTGMLTESKPFDKIGTAQFILFPEVGAP